MLTGTCHGVFEDWLEEILKGSAPSRRRRVLACQRLRDSGHPLSPFFYVFVWPNHNAGDVPNCGSIVPVSTPFMAFSTVYGKNRFRLRITLCPFRSHAKNVSPTAYGNNVSI